MVKIIGLWELGYNVPLIENDLWIYPLRDYGVDEFYMSPVSGIQSEYVKEVSDVPTFLDEHRNAGNIIVFVDERGEEDLEFFNHPENCIYVFGKASTSLMAGHKKSSDKSVFIKTKNNLGTLWPHQAAVLVLHDRLRKA